MTPSLPRERRRRSGSFLVIDNQQPLAGVHYPSNLREFERMFASDAACRGYLKQLRWPKGFVCHACGSSDEPWSSAAGLLKCRTCDTLTVATQGTIFHGSPIPLTRWFRGLWEMTERDKMANAAAVGRALGVEGDDAEAYAALLREVMGVAHAEPLAQPVELGLTTVKVDGRDGHVVLCLEREGDLDGRIRVRARHMPRVTREAIVHFVCTRVAPGTPVHAPNAVVFDGVRAAGYPLVTLARDGAAESVTDVRRVASVLRCWLWGVNGMREATLAAYLDEFCFRYNRRDYARGLLFYRLMILATTPQELAQPRVAESA